jgi:hypothetical protein
MGRRWKRSSLKVTTGLILSTVLASQGFAQHPSVKLLDLDGNSVKSSLNATDTVTLVSNNGTEVTLERGNPVSFEKTLSLIHI